MRKKLLTILALMLVSATGYCTEPQTFSQLNTDITNASDELNLADDYKWTNASATSGIVINKAITINGNGHCIDGDNQSRIFDIQTTAAVTLSNIVFMNSIGGAIFSNSNNLIIENCVFISEENPVIIVNPESETASATATNCWFGNTADDYKTRANVAGNVFMEDWLFLDATANPEEIEIGGSTSVVFKLYSYNNTANKTSDYDASGMNILLYLTRTKGELDKTTAALGTAIDYTATVVGNGSVTGSFGNVEYTIPITVNKISTEISIANASIGLTIGEGVNAGATLTPAEAGNLSYSSNDATIASVDAAGNISALKEGTTTIAVSFTGNDRYAAAENKTIEVTVSSNVTAIGKLDTRTGEESADSDEWYSIDGRKLNGKPDAKGLYIKNGKKVVIKE
ncbi:MAG: Ig-like domain-containing protein [Bacteroidales bacterium]|nr:Ig-like domain-containing protein [Bacteroidales bacterium]